MCQWHILQGEFTAMLMTLLQSVIWTLWWFEIYQNANMLNEWQWMWTSLALSSISSRECAWRSCGFLIGALTSLSRTYSFLEAAQAKPQSDLLATEQLHWSSWGITCYAQGHDSSSEEQLLLVHFSQLDLPCWSKNRNIAIKYSTVQKY